MIDWNRWLPGLGQDEPEEEESAVSKTLRALGQGASAVQQGATDLYNAAAAPVSPVLGETVRGAAQSAYDALPAIRQPATDLYESVQAPMAAHGPGYGPRPLPEDQTPWTQTAGPAIQAGATGLYNAAQDPTNAVETGKRAIQAGYAAAADAYVPDTPAEIATAAVMPPLHFSNVAQAGWNAATDEIGRGLGRAAGTSTDPIAEAPGYGPVSSEDIAGGVAQTVLDPTNLIGAPAAKAAVRAAPRVGRELAEGAVRAAGNVAEDVGQAARRVTPVVDPGLQGALRAPETRRAAGVADEILTPQAARVTADALSPVPADPMPWADVSRRINDPARAAETERALEEARQRWMQGLLPRSPEEQLLTEEYGRRWSDIPPTEQPNASRQRIAEVAAPRERGSRADVEAARRMPDYTPQSISLNARPGIGASAGLVGDLGNAVGGGVAGAAAGAGLPAETEEERRRNALYGAGIGMLAGPAAGRLLPSPRGAQARFGVGGRPANQASRAASSPNPHIRNTARQMAGQYTPSGVGQRPLTERIVAALTDKHAIVGNVEQEIQGRVTAAGGQAPATRLAERVRENPNSVAAQRAREELAPAFQAVGEDADWMEQVLVHRHNLDVAAAKGQEAYDAAIAAGRSPQRAQQIADRVSQSRAFSGGMNAQDLQDALSDIQTTLGPARWQQVQQSAQAVWDTGRKSLDEKLAEGMISPALHQELTTRYPHYVRTDIADYFEGGPAMPSPGGKTMGVSTVGIKPISAVGTTKDRVNPVLSTIDALYSHEAAMTRNAAAKDLAQLRDADPTARGLFKEVAPDAQAWRRNRAEMVPPDYSLRNGEQKLTAWENGEARQFVIPAEYAGLLNPKQGALLGDSALASGTRGFFGLWKSLITTHNPGFQMVVSPVRDLGDYAVGEATRSATKGGVRGMAQAAGALPGVVGDYLKALPAAFEGLGTGQFSQEVGDLRRAGAGFEGRPARTDSGLREAYADLKTSGGVALRTPADMLKATRTILTLGAEPVGSRLELVPRIAAARRAAGRGADELGQAIASKDATIDFLRGGWLTQQLNVVVPFINPTVQSSAQVARLAKRNPAAAAAAVGTAIGVPAMLAEAWNRSDEQRAAAYADVPESVKNTGIVWMLPDTVAGSTELGEAKPNYLWVPLGSFAFAARLAREGLALADPLTGLTPRPERPGREADGPIDAAARAAEIGGEILAMFSPVKGDSISSSVASLIPPVASEAVEIGVNKDLYRGSTIATDRRDENASRVSQGVAAGLNALGGTDQVRASQVEHVVRGVGGYAGQLATAASDLGRDRGVSRPIQDIPVVGALASRVIRDTGGQRLEDERSIPARAPEAVRATLAEAGMRSDEVTPVSSRYKDAPLTHAEQERWQRMTNALVTREVLALRRTAEWRERGADKQKLVGAAIASAREQAAERALPRLTDREIEQRKAREERRKAG